MFLAIDRVYKFVCAEFRAIAEMATGARFMRGVVAAFPCQIHTVLTGNGVAFTKDATTKVSHYEATQALCAHVLASVAAFSFGKRLKALRWRTPFQAICDAWKSDPASFKINRSHLTMGLYT